MEVWNYLPILLNQVEGILKAPNQARRRRLLLFIEKSCKGQGELLLIEHPLSQDISPTIGKFWPGLFLV
jgi:hypothetical protein